MTMAVKTLLIMAGGTGGHIFPAVAIANEMQRRAWTVEWLGTTAGMETTLVPKAGYRLHTLSFDGLVGKGLAAKLLFPMKLLRALVAARGILKRVQPSVVLGMGGFPALPGGLMAAWMRTPLVTHEQNAVAGQTNRVLAKRATRVLAAFAGAYKFMAVRAQVIGNPVRATIVECGVAREPWDGSRPLRVAVVGGSRGAQALNEIVPQALAKIPTPQRPSVIHQCGAGKSESVRDLYRRVSVQAEVRDFVDDMAALYSNIDLIICRSGASTVSEIACAELPAIFVPYPHHADRQQFHNANALAAAGGAHIMEQGSLDAETLAHALLQLTPAQLATMRSVLRTLATPNATHDIADVIEEVGGAR
jgi:UDP-N-acetylglucosamine--N-acetylmuramyl-(pentapeptide) pyrophosphoryl-undecaprenol N-acetylglucosamine transferase